LPCTGDTWNGAYSKKMQSLNEVERRRVRRTLSEVKRKFEEALRLSRRRDAVMSSVLQEKRSH
jgi:hypothetical protein